MKSSRVLLTLALIVGCHGAFAACDQTLSPGANVAAAVSNAPAGTTVCLASGNYGNVTLAGISKASDVTIQSASGRTASAGFTINNGSNHLRIQSMTVSGLGLDGSATKNITIAGNTFTGQANINTTNFNNNNIVIDGNSFDGISVCSSCAEGRLQIAWPGGPGSVSSGVVVTNNHFGGAGESDGIQIGAYGVVVGPGNVFDGIQQLNYSRHVDAIQLYGQSHTTITGNYFVNNDSQVMAPDGGNTETITNNVFVASSGNNGIQLGTHMNDLFSHNTVINVTVNMDKKSDNPTPSQNNVARDNIMLGTSHFKTVDSNGVPSCSNCTFDNNLFNVSGNSSGTNIVIGSPQFTGGANPTTWPGYRLTSSSLGYRTATDGNDLGSNYFGTPAMPAPTNLRVQ